LRGRLRATAAWMEACKAWSFCAALCWSRSSVRTADDRNWGESSPRVCRRSLRVVWRTGHTPCPAFHRADGVRLSKGGSPGSDITTKISLALGRAKITPERGAPNYADPDCIITPMFTRIHSPRLKSCSRSPFRTTPQEMLQLEQRLSTAQRRLPIRMVLVQLTRAHEAEAFVNPGHCPSARRARCHSSTRASAMTSVLLLGGTALS